MVIEARFLFDNISRFVKTFVLNGNGEDVVRWMKIRVYLWGGKQRGSR